MHQIVERYFFACCAVQRERVAPAYHIAAKRLHPHEFIFGHAATGQHLCERGFVEQHTEAVRRVGFRRFWRVRRPPLTGRAKGGKAKSKEQGFHVHFICFERSGRRPLPPPCTVFAYHVFATAAAFKQKNRFQKNCRAAQTTSQTTPNTITKNVRHRISSGACMRPLPVGKRGKPFIAAIRIVASAGLGRRCFPQTGSRWPQKSVASVPCLGSGRSW